MGIEYEKTGPGSFEVRTSRHDVTVTMAGDAPAATVLDRTTGEVVLDAAGGASGEIRKGAVQFSATSAMSFVLRLPDACIEADASAGSLEAEIWNTPWPTADEASVAAFERENAFSL